MERLLRTSLALCAVALIAPLSALAATQYVAPGLSVPLNTNCTTPGFNSIQAAVTASSPGDTIVVCDGVYEEKVSIARSLTLLGSGNSVIDAPSSPAQLGDLVEIVGKTTVVTMSGFIVSGPGPSGCASIQAGIRVRDAATLDLSFSRITDIRDVEPSTGSFSGCQNGEGIRVGSRGGVGGPGNATIDNVIVQDYQKNGITISGAGTTARVTNSTISGGGPTAVIAQNGVQISAGALGHVSNSVIRNHDYTPNSFFACGLLFFDAGGVDDDDNVYWGNEKDKCGALGRGGTYSGLGG